MITINYEEVAQRALELAGGPVRGPLMNAIREIEPTLEHEDVNEVIAIAFRLGRSPGGNDEQRSLRPPRQVTTPDAGTSTPEGEMPRENDGMSPKQRALVMEVVQKMAGKKVKDIKKVLRDQVGLIVPVPLIKQMQKGAAENGNGKAPKKRTQRRKPVRRGVKGRRTAGKRRAAELTAPAITPAEDRSGTPVLQLFRSPEPGMARILIDVTVPAGSASALIEQLGEALAAAG